VGRRISGKFQYKIRNARQIIGQYEQADNDQQQAADDFNRFIISLEKCGNMKKPLHTQSRYEKRNAKARRVNR